MRSLQGLIFFALALFGFKWEFHPRYFLGLREYLPDTQPPLGPEGVLGEAAILAAIGVFLLVTGEIFSWRRQGSRYSFHTFLAAATAFIALFTRKWSYLKTDNFADYLPPFNEETFGLAFILLYGLMLYFLVRGEVQFWRNDGSVDKAPQRE